MDEDLPTKGPLRQTKTPANALIPQKPASLSDVLKIVVKRRDIAKWIEFEEYRLGIRGSLVRVHYNKQYLLAEIDDFKAESLEYKVEQRMTKFQILLRNQGKVKQFKISMISDRDPSEAEYLKLMQDNPKLQLTNDSVELRQKQIKDATWFLYDKNEFERLLNEQNYNKIRQRNFNGLNLTSIRMTLKGELALAEADIADFQHEQNSQIDLSELEKKRDDLRELMAIVEQGNAIEAQQLAEKDVKMGAKIV